MMIHAIFKLFMGRLNIGLGNAFNDIDDERLRVFGQAIDDLRDVHRFGRKIEVLRFIAQQLEQTSFIRFEDFTQGLTMCFRLNIRATCTFSPAVNGLLGHRKAIQRKLSSNIAVAHAK